LGGEFVHFARRCIVQTLPDRHFCVRNQSLTQMKHLIIFGIWSLLTGMLTSHTATAQVADQILGKWQDAAHPEKQVEFHKTDGRYTGRVINAPKASRSDQVIFRDLVWNDQRQTYQGILINPDNADEYKVEVSLTDTDTFQFKAGKLIFYKTFVFKRI
jgi:uncharacterized protein (DUF2147 family)